MTQKKIITPKKITAKPLIPKTALNNGGVKKPIVKKPVTQPTIKPTVKPVVKPTIKKPIVKKPVVKPVEAEEENIVVENEDVMEEVVESEDILAEEEVEETLEDTIEEDIEEVVDEEENVEVYEEENVSEELDEEDEEEQEPEEEVVVKKKPIVTKTKVDVATNKPKKNIPISQLAPKPTYEVQDDKEMLDSIASILEMNNSKFIKRDDVIALLRNRFTQTLRVKDPDLFLSNKDVLELLGDVEGLILDVMSYGLEMSIAGTPIKRNEVPMRLWNPSKASSDNHIISNPARQHIKYTYAKHLNKPKTEENLEGKFDPDTNIFTTLDGRKFKLTLQKSIIEDIVEID